jgi:GTP-binding protein EngB required for normal cell division
MTELIDVLDACDLAIARADGLLDGPLLADLQHRAAGARRRDGFLGEALVLAFAGGTGSGKSSILNAMVGTDVVPTGIVRPTTQVATAVHANREFTDLAPLIGAIGVTSTIIEAGAGDIVFVDLPDFDSTEAAHRHVVEEVLPRVDAVIWVLDPEKYADPVLHQEFLERLVPYEAQFVFALNQVDRLGEHRIEVVANLEELLRSDGFAMPQVVSTVAVPLGDAPPDVESLSNAVAQRLDAKATAIGKIAADMRAVARDGYAGCHAVDRRNMGDQSLDGVALAAASFVWLGVMAYELHDRVTTDAGGP